ncbi:hypothetical protein [Dietzia sp. ANT_WB102]|uniref:hypothetical protein n=1 Tax=Dietzia sp. ANT_WB102 TaxID=2597345 RepID=UPI0011EDEF80|nr:hypothetical protein [Dietzia sp. ANT_WB102]KAA0918958.1 hypothetical protein FQ137_06590 [Dietzia sp. ANT_WB102]
MSSAPARPRRTVNTTVVIALGIVAAALALGTRLLTIGPSLTTAIASAEFAAGAALMTRTTWILPALFTVTVFAGMVITVHLIGARRTPQVTEAPTGTPNAQPISVIPFELRAPDRALAEASRGLFRSIDS